MMRSKPSWASSRIGTSSPCSSIAIVVPPEAQVSDRALLDEGPHLLPYLRHQPRRLHVHHFALRLGPFFACRVSSPCERMNAIAAHVSGYSRQACSMLPAF